MPRKRQTVAALRATGSRHYTKAQLEAREAQEVPKLENNMLEPPIYLGHNLTAKFYQLANTLAGMGILTALDADGLARYLIAEQNYLRATNRLTAAINSGHMVEADKWSAIQDRFFRQCRAAGNDLGLTASGRCPNTPLISATTTDASGEEAELFGEG